MFEDLEELTKSDRPTNRNRWVAIGVISVCAHIALIAFVLLSVVFLPGGSGARRKNMQMALLTDLALPPLPRPKPATNNQAVGNLAIEREAVSLSRDNRSNKTTSPQEQLTSQNANVRPTKLDLPPNVNVPANAPKIQLEPISPVPAPALAPPVRPAPPDERKPIDPDEFMRKIHNPKLGSGSASGGSASGRKGIDLGNAAGLDLGSYKPQLQKRLEASWQATKSNFASMQHANASVVVSFDWNRDGTLKNISVDVSTGSPILDREARAAVQNISPFSPIPSTIELDVIRMNATFTY